MALAARCSRGFLAGMLPLNCHHGHRFDAPRTGGALAKFCAGASGVR